MLSPFQRHPHALSSLRLLIAPPKHKLPFLPHLNQNRLLGYDQPVAWSNMSTWQGLLRGNDTSSPCDIA